MVERQVMEDCFRATQRYLASGSTPLETHLQARQTEALSLLRLYAFSDDAHQAAVGSTGTGYFLRHERRKSPGTSVISMARSTLHSPVVRARLSPAGEGIQVMIYTPDKERPVRQDLQFFSNATTSTSSRQNPTPADGYALDSTWFGRGQPIRHYRDLLSFIEYELSQRLTPDKALGTSLARRLSRHLKHFPDYAGSADQA